MEEIEKNLNTLGEEVKKFSEEREGTALTELIVNTLKTEIMKRRFADSNKPPSLLLHETAKEIDLYFF